MFKILFCLLCCLLCCLLIPAEVFSEEGSRLTEISEKIEDLKFSQQKIEKEIRINAEESRKTAAELEQLEAEILQINTRKKDLIENTAMLSEQISDTEERITALKADSNKRLRALYISPARGGLINTAIETDVDSASRYIWYFKKLRAYELYVLQEEQRLNDSLKMQKDSFASGQSEIETSTEKLLKSKTRLLESQNRQSRLLADLKRQKSDNAKIVLQLRAEFLRIETAISNLSASESVTTVSNDASIIKAASQAEKSPDAESMLSAKFQAPVKGKLVNRYGSRIEDTLGQKITSKGLGFDVPEGADVNCVGAGKVVFAGPLGDYGQVVIVDHGGRIHTLYSMLASSEVKPGQQLQAMSIIGKAGKITAPRRYNAYFELRVAGQAQNPEPRMDLK